MGHTATLIPVALLNRKRLNKSRILTPRKGRIVLFFSTALNIDLNYGNNFQVLELETWPKNWVKIGLMLMLKLNNITKTCQTNRKRGMLRKKRNIKPIWQLVILEIIIFLIIIITTITATTLVIIVILSV